MPRAVGKAGGLAVFGLGFCAKMEWFCRSGLGRERCKARNVGIAANAAPKGNSIELSRYSLSPKTLIALGLGW